MKTAADGEGGQSSLVTWAMLTNDNLATCREAARMIVECDKKDQLHQDHVCAAAEQRMEKCDAMGRLMKEVKSKWQQQQQKQQQQ